VRNPRCPSVGLHPGAGAAFVGKAVSRVSPASGGAGLTRTEEFSRIP